MNDEFEIDGSRRMKYHGSAENVVIPKGVTHIWDEAFRECQSIVSVEIPSSVCYISRCAFWGCGSLKSVTLKSEKRNFWNARMETVSREVGVEKIEFEAFRYCCKKLTTIHLPETLKRIADYAFVACESLTSM